MNLTISLGLVPPHQCLTFRGFRFEQMGNDSRLVTMRCVETFRVDPYQLGEMLAMPVDTQVEVDEEEWEKWIQRGWVTSDHLVVTALERK